MPPAASAIILTLLLLATPAVTSAHTAVTINRTYVGDTYGLELFGPYGTDAAELLYGTCGADVQIGGAKICNGWKYVGRKIQARVVDQSQALGFPPVGGKVVVTNKAGAVLLEKWYCEFVAFLVPAGAERITVAVSMVESACEFGGVVTAGTVALKTY